MLLFLKNGSNISDNVAKDSLRITEQLNNRTNTADFRIFTNEVTANDVIEIREVFKLRESASSGQPDIVVLDTYREHDVFRAGDELSVDILGTPVYHTIDSIDHDTYTVTFTENLTDTYDTSTLCGRKIFAGVVLKSPNVEIGVSGEFEWSVTVGDRTSAMNRKNIVDSYQNMYIREIIGRGVFGFCANDSESILETFEAARTQGGVGSAMADEDTDRLVGMYSQKTGTSGSGTATRTKTLGAPVDISAMTDIRLWHKQKEGEGAKITSLKIRVGNDASNYLERTSVYTGANQEDCRNRENFKIDRGVETGTVNLATVDRLQLEVVCTAAVDADGLLFDQMLATSGGFTLKNCLRGDRKFTSFKSNYKKLSEVIETLAKTTAIFRLVDYDRDIRIFNQNTTPAPFGLTDTSTNYSDLEIDPDVSQLRNRQTVRGGEAPSTSTYTQEHVADGNETSRALDYKPKDLTVEVDDGGGFDAKTVGVENLVDESTVDFVFNYQEKVVRNASHATLGQGDIIKITYYPYQSIRVRVQSPTSIAYMKSILGGDGIFDGPVIEDKSIETYADARLRAQAELEAYANPVISANFTTEKGGLHAGQILHILDSSRSIDDDYLIQRVTRRSLFGGAESAYSVECGSTMFGLIEFFQFLLKKATTLGADDSEILDILINQDETITINDSIVPVTKSKTFVAAAMLVNKWIDFVGMSGNIATTGIIVTDDFDKQRYASFSGSAVGEVGFDESSDYHIGNSLYIDVDTGGGSQYIRARRANLIPVKSGVEYDIALWVQNLVSGGLTGGDGLTIQVVEYAANLAYNALATNNIIVDRNTKQDFDQITGTFTTNASTTHIDIVITVNESTGKVSIGEIVLQEQQAESQSNPAIVEMSEVV